MSHEKNKYEDPDMKAFEAALAALRPCADRLDSRWRSLLAEEASQTAAILPSPAGRGAGGEGCVNPAGHRFLCIHCGSEAPATPRIRRWAWPTAFSGMTAVAAVLLMMLAVRPAPPIADRPEEPRVESAPMSDYGLAESSASPFHRDHQSNEMPYLALRNQVLRNGVESWKSPVSMVVTTARSVDEPLSYREQLDRLLKEQGCRGS